MILRQAPRLTLALLTLPVAAGVLGTLIPAISNDLKGVKDLLEWPGLSASVALSLKSGLLSTLSALIVTMLIVASLRGTRAFALIQHLLAPLLAVPHAAAALGIAFLIAPSGWIARVVSPWATGWDQPPDLLILNDPGGWALTVGLIAKELPFLLLMALAALPQTDAERRVLQAQSLGAGKVMGFMIAVMPALYVQLRLPVYAVLAYAMTTVEMALILGPTRPLTLSSQIVIWMNDPSLGDKAMAAAAASLQLLIVLGAIAVWRGAESVLRLLLVRLAEGGLRLPRLDLLARLISIILGLGFALLLGAGLVGLGVWSMAGIWSFPDALPNTLSFATWERVWSAIRSSTGTTLAIAITATASSLVLVVACLEAERRFALASGTRALGILYLPLIVPQIAFLPGLHDLMLRIGLGTTWMTVAMVHMVFVLPYVFLSLSAPFRALDPRLGLTAQSLGASHTRILFTIRLPILLRPLLTAAAVGIAVSIGQYLPTLLIGGGRVETLTTEAVALSSGGNRRLIGAYGLAQTLLPALGFALALMVPAMVFRNRRQIQVRG